MKKITYDIMLTKETVQALSLPEDAATLPFALLSASDMKDLPGLDFSDWKADMEDLGYAAEWDEKKPSRPASRPGNGISGKSTKH